MVAWWRRNWLGHYMPLWIPEKNAASEQQWTRVSVIVAETSFFWRNATKSRMDARAGALHALSLAASQQLATRRAISNTNPFYERLTGSSSPVGREDFPKPG
jgi:hypothetical protein